MEEHAAAWTKPSRPSNGSNLVVIPRTYTGGRSPRSWVQLHAEQPHPALRQLASPTRGQRMLCESQPPVSYAEAKTHRLSARTLVSCEAPAHGYSRMLSNRTQLFVSSHLLLAANACSASLSPQSLTQRPKPTVSVLAHSSPAVRRDAETTAQPRRMDPSFSHQPTPTVHSSRLRRHPTSSLFSPPALPLTPPNTLLFSGASPCASVLPYLYIYLTSC